MVRWQHVLSGIEIGSRLNTGVVHEWRSCHLSFDSRMTRTLTYLNVENWLSTSQATQSRRTGAEVNYSSMGIRRRRYCLSKNQLFERVNSNWFKRHLLGGKTFGTFLLHG